MTNGGDVDERRRRARDGAICVPERAARAMHIGESRFNSLL